MTRRRDGAASWGQIGGILGTAGGLLFGWLSFPNDSDFLNRLGFLALIGGVSGGIIGVLLGGPATRAGTPEAPFPHLIGPNALESWRVWLRTASSQRSEQLLEQMIRGREVLPRGVQKVTLDERLHRSNARVLLDTLEASWIDAPTRLVILGDPGYGKTVTALTLTVKLNRNGSAGAAPCAVLFRLAEWPQWVEDTTTHPRLEDWLSERLAEEYKTAGLTRSMAAELVARGLVIPMLDGLDEVRAADREACLRAINVYSGFAAPFRPFVLTTRVGEYGELSPEWAAADQHIYLPGLATEQILELVEDETERRPMWADVLVRLRSAPATDPAFALFASPLRTDLILSAFRNSSPLALLDMNLEDAKATLWKMSLNSNASSFADEDVARRSRWLSALARAMTRENAQRLHMYDLDMLLVDGDAAFKRFNLTLAIALCSINFVGSAALSRPQSLPDMFFLCSAFLFLFIVILASRKRPVVFALPTFDASLRVLVSQLPRTAIICTIAFLLGWKNSLYSWMGMDATVTRGLVAAAVSFVAFAASDLLFTNTTDLEVYAPRSVHRIQGPRAIIRAMRNRILLTCVMAGITGASLCGILISYTNEPSLLVWRFVWASVVVALVTTLHGGLGFLLYHQWVQWKLWRADLMPRDAIGFLDWCSQPARGWLRVSTAYEWRHRELLDFLSRRQGE